MVICINLTLGYIEDQLLFAVFYPGAIILSPILGCLWVFLKKLNN